MWSRTPLTQIPNFRQLQQQPLRIWNHLRSPMCYLDSGLLYFSLIKGMVYRFTVVQNSSKFHRLLRRNILLQCGHPVVVEDINRLMKSKHNENVNTFNLDWEEEPKEDKPKWLKKHWAMMQELEALKSQKCLELHDLITQRVSLLCKSLSIRSHLMGKPCQVDPKKLKPLRASKSVVHSQRVQHALDIFNTAGGFENRFINTSQSIERMASTRDDVMPCVTPSGAFFSMALKRYVTGSVTKSSLPLAGVWNPAGAEKLMLQGFPIHTLKLKHLSNKASWLIWFYMVLWCMFFGRGPTATEEIHSLAGNAFHVKSIAAAYACAFSVCNLTKFNQAMDNRMRS